MMDPLRSAKRGRSYGETRTAGSPTVEVNQDHGSMKRSLEDARLAVPFVLRVPGRSSKLATPWTAR
jgi:hypothetical protein